MSQLAREIQSRFFSSRSAWDRAKLGLRLVEKASYLRARSHPVSLLPVLTKASRFLNSLTIFLKKMCLLFFFPLRIRGLGSWNADWWDNLKGNWSKLLNWNVNKKLGLVWAMWKSPEKVVLSRTQAISMYPVIWLQVVLSMLLDTPFLELPSSWGCPWKIRDLEGRGGKSILLFT